MILSAFPFFSSVALARDKSDKVKVVLLFKFFDYITWLSGKKLGENGEGLLCTYGRHFFGGALDYIAARKSGKYRLRTKKIGSLDIVETRR